MSELKDAIDRLRSAQKSSRGAPAYSRFVNRPLGRVFAAVFFVGRWTPDQVTLLSALFTFTGIGVIAFAPPTWYVGIGVTLLLAIGYALDSADGQLARLRGGGSATGEWLDHMMDAIKMSTIHLAVLLCWFRSFDLALGWMAVPIVFQVVSTVFFFGVILTELLRRTKSAGAAAPPANDRRSSTLYSLAVLPADYGLLLLSFVLLGWHPGFVFVYTALAALNLAILALSLPRWHRSLSAASRA